MKNTFLCGEHVMIAYVGLPGWRATVLESNTKVPGFQTLTVRDAQGQTHGFFCHRQKWYSAFGRRRVLIGTVEREAVSA